MISRNNFDLKAYLVVGPENTNGRNVIDVIRQAVEGGFTFVQIRSKIATARELIDLTVEAADLIKEMGKENEVALVVNDRLDVILAARERGAKVDGIHVGQTDIPVDVCRKYLGQDSIIGLSAATIDLINYVKNENVENIDYFGAGPIRETSTKPEAGFDKDGNFYKKSFEEISELAKISKMPVVIGGGVKLGDIKALFQTGVGGFFVVSAVAGAENPKIAANQMVEAWDEGVKK